MSTHLIEPLSIAIDAVQGEESSSSNPGVSRVLLLIIQDKSHLYN